MPFCNPSAQTPIQSMITIAENMSNARVLRAVISATGLFKSVESLRKTSVASSAYGKFAYEYWKTQQYKADKV